MDAPLPDYVVYNDDTISAEIRAKLKEPSAPYEFPLSDSDLNEIKILETKYDSEESIAGLAAPQIGIQKRAIVFAVPDDPDLKKFRKDINETMPKSIWINPEFKPVGNETSIDMEACFSYKDYAGPVERYRKISYTAYALNGEKISGTASGYLARVIQHETDHLNGIIFTDKVPEGELFNIEEYKRNRAKAIAGEEST